MTPRSETLTTPESHRFTEGETPIYLQEQCHEQE